MHTATIPQPFDTVAHRAASRRGIAVRAAQRNTHPSRLGTIGLLLGVMAFCCGLALVPNLRDRAAAPRSVLSVRVVAADTLWRIARSHPVAGLSTAEAVELIRVSNHLPSDAVLQPGVVLQVPSDAQAATDMLAMR